MKPNCPYYYIALAFILFSNFHSLAQHQVEYLNTNMINAGFGIGGNLFSRIDSNPTNSMSALDPNDLWSLSEVPQGSEKRDVYTASIWMSGLDSLGNAHCAAQQYNLNGPDFYDGPIADGYDSLYRNYYKRIFKVTQTQINHHKTLSFPASPNNIDSSILFWPGAGNPYVASTFGVNINHSLAPFVDINHDLIYNPLQGDYPAICGDEAVFFVFNDEAGPHFETQTSESLGVEIRGMAYEFTDSSTENIAFAKRPINNTVFVQYDIENKKTINYRNFYLGLFEDADIGCPLNDFVGCDSSRNMMFAYNGTSTDETCVGELGYSPYQIAHGVIMLNNLMSNYVYFTQNDVPVVSANSPGCDLYSQYMSGYWADSMPFTEGGTGYGGTYPTHYIFSGNPNDTSTWSEVSAENQLPPGDRSSVGSIGPVNFNPGEIKHFDFAFTTSYDSTATMNSIVDTLKRNADIVQAFYNNTVAPCRNQLSTLLNVNEIENYNQVKVLIYPNPTNNKLTIQIQNSTSTSMQITVTDISGQTLLHQTINPSVKNELDVAALPAGLYFIQVQDGKQSLVRKFVKE